MADRRVTRVPRPTFARPNARQSSLGGSRWVGLALRHWRQIGLVLVLVWFWGVFNVKTIAVSGVRQISANSLQSATAEILHKQFWSANLISLDSAGLSKQLAVVEPRIKSVKVGRRWPNKIELAITEKQPALWWQTGQQNYWLDVDGSIIGPAKEGQTLAIVVDSANLPVKVGDRVVPPTFVRFCTDLVQSITARTGVGVNGLKVPDTTSEVYASTNKGYMIKFDTTRSAGEQVEDLANVLATLTKQHKAPVEYVDLRIEHKAYYR